MKPFARLLALISLLAAGCSSFPTKPEPPGLDGAALWERLTFTDSSLEVPKEEERLSEFFVQETPNAEICGAHRVGLEHYLDRIPVDIGAWRLAEQCARLVDDAQWLQLARAHIDALVAFAFKDGRSLQPWRPASVLHAWDVPELAAERGLEVKWLRIRSLDSARYLLVETSMVDSQGQERRYYFDLLDALIRLNADGETRLFPAERRTLAFSVLEADALAGDPLALTGYLFMDLEAGELHPVPARRALTQAWENGVAGGGILLMELCLFNDDLDCDAALMESVTEGLIEREIAEGHALYAARLLRDGRTIDDSEVQLALDEASMLSERGRMLFYLADVLAQPGSLDTGSPDEIIEDLLRQAAQAGNPVADLRLAAIAIAQAPDDAALDDNTRAHLDQAVDAGIPFALYLKGLAADMLEERVDLIFRAAELGVPDAQFFRAVFLAAAGDRAQEQEIERWLLDAADGGSVAAMRMLAQRRLTETDPGIQPEAAAAWLYSALEFGDNQSAAWFAGLLKLHPELHPEPDNAALDMLEVLAVDAGRAATISQLDRLFRVAPPFLDHPDKARELLIGLSDRGWAEASLQLALLAEYELRAREYEAKVLHWYQRAIEQGSVQARYDLGSFQLYEIGDKTAATESFRKAADSGHVWAANDLAYMLCTGEQGIQREPAEGLIIIQDLFEAQDDRHPYHYSTLAACHAATGNFDAALRNHRIALDRAENELPEETDVHEQMRHRLSLYRSGQPYMASPPPAD